MTEFKIPESVRAPAAVEPERGELVKNAPGLATWKCVCGHPLYVHSPARDQNSAGHPYQWHVCGIEGCDCEEFVSEYDAAAGEQ